MWYRQGTVTVTNGSNVVTGAGTDFVANASIGEAFIGPDGRTYEIAQIVSATDLRLATGYQAATGGGQAYAIHPTQSFARDLALAAAALLNTFAAVRDGAGQGMFPAGGVAAPAVRFIGDQDTGLFSGGANVLGLAAGGSAALTLSAARADFSGHIKLGDRKAVGLVPDTDTWSFASGPVATYGMTVGVNIGAGGPATVLAGFGGLIFGTGAIEQARIDNTGNLLVGVTSGAAHRIEKSGLSEGSVVLGIAAGAGSAITAEFRRVNASPFNGGAPAALMLGHNTTNNRSATTSGTVNVSGADYAEYMVKAAGCGIIAKGDVCGVDRDGRLTKTWADAISFVVKSTDPSLVGGDTWAAHLPPRPDAPGAEPQPPALPMVPAEDADMATYRDALAAYQALVAQYRVDHDAWAAATAAYERDLPAWEAELEAARICVDRIAFCGQVPCNVSGDFNVGDYIVAAANGGGIKAVAMKLDDMTLAQYARRIGKVWAIRDDRAWIDVQHG